MSRNIPSKTVRSGRNADETVYKDDQYVRCWNCGFPCNTGRDRRSPVGSHGGDGISLLDAGRWGAEEWGTELWGGSSLTDPTVTAGCPHCGCLHYDSKH